MCYYHVSEYLCWALHEGPVALCVMSEYLTRAHYIRDQCVLMALNSSLMWAVHEVPVSSYVMDGCMSQWAVAEYHRRAVHKAPVTLHVMSVCTSQVGALHKGSVVMGVTESFRYSRDQSVSSQLSMGIHLLTALCMLHKICSTTYIMAEQTQCTCLDPFPWGGCSLTY